MSVPFEKLNGNLLEQIIHNSYDAIFVSDNVGNVIMANKAAEKTMGVSANELIGVNVENLVADGVYEWSPTLKAIKTRTVVTGFVKTSHGANLMVISTPVMDENNEVAMVVTNARDKNLIDKYLTQLEKEKAETARYKTVAGHLSEMDFEQKSLVAESPQMQKILETSNFIAKTDSTVILFGESGTGKEVMARYLHRNSFRSKEPFIPVNCAAIPSELLESEFFGYVRGAFTGANAQGKSGLFEIADKGTLFLDEIAELPLPMQSKLLRVFESGEIKRVGGTTVYRTNVRLIAATNRDLKAMIDQKLFRNDLYYRLNVIPIKLPPLRERPEDIVIIAHKFLAELNRKYGLQKSFPEHTINAFLEYNWPGNVRELRNVIERLVVTSTHNTLDFHSNQLSGNTASVSKECLPGVNPAYQGTLKSVIKKVEKEYIDQVLAECDGRVGEAAKRLGIHRTMLYRKTKTEFQD